MSTVTNKKCSKCCTNLMVSLDNFRVLSNGYWTTQCRECERLLNKLWYKKNKNKHYDLVKKWKQEHPQKTKDFQKKSCKKYYENNKECILKKKAKYRARPEVIKRTNEWNAERRKNNPYLKIKQNISVAVNYALKKHGGTKNRQSIWNHLGYTSDDLKKWLKSQWESWMGWGNYGIYNRGGQRTWHIDHIIPQSKLPYDSMGHPNFHKCWALNNLRPLEASKNISDGARN